VNRVYSTDRPPHVSAMAMCRLQVEKGNSLDGKFQKAQLGKEKKRKRKRHHTYMIEISRGSPGNEMSWE